MNEIKKQIDDTIYWFKINCKTKLLVKGKSKKLLEI